MRCGREPRGARVADLGVCPATLERRTDGMNRGINGGRVCYAVAGTLCGGKIQGTFASKLASCLACDFYRLVRREEADRCCTARDALTRLARGAPPPAYGRRGPALPSS
jgi:hypothetical protein